MRGEAMTTTEKVKTAGRRGGYAIGALVNVVLLWVAHQLLDWEWPGFLTQDYDDLLPLITFSFVVSIVGYVVMAVVGAGGLPRQLFDTVSAAIGAVVLFRFLQVFPFDFSDYDTDWSWLVRAGLIVALVGAILGFLVGIVKLLTWSARHRDGAGSAPNSELGESTDRVR